MWERFRKAGGKAGKPAVDLQLGIRALQGLFVVTPVFLIIEWIRSRELPFEFLVYGLSLELFLFVLLWSLFRMGRLHRQTMHWLALWVAAAVSLPLSVYLTLVDAGGEIRFLLLLIWFLAYGRNTGILLTFLYISGVAALLLLSGKFDFFAGNDPIRSLVRASLLALSLLPLLLFLRARLMARSVMPVRLTHLLLHLIRSWNQGRPESSPGARLRAPEHARDLWAYLRDSHEEGIFSHHGPGSRSFTGYLLELKFLNPWAFAGPQMSPAAIPEIISRRLMEWQDHADALCGDSIWMNATADGVSIFCEDQKGPDLIEVCEGMLRRLSQERNSSRARGMEYPQIVMTLYHGPLWIVTGRAEEQYALAHGVNRGLTQSQPEHGEWAPAENLASNTNPALEEVESRSSHISPDSGQERQCLSSWRFEVIQQKDGEGKPAYLSFADGESWLDAIKKILHPPK
ncbi:MAG TPA: hypothetical protein DEA96_07530 [Leptospiraceae bacterium]|nr:hypothetical protein [Spirochaetaceae bacterium]HBS04796.1 hypothetical protein [Leptospiraceae bacterium]|tara:strand:+ start:14999 stop:16372 length:1374 start_codon:yes stop_codon:yes gene_type:complete